MGWNDYSVKPFNRGGMIVGLAGFARSGKDTVGKILVDNHGFTRISFATPVYDGLYALNPSIVMTDSDGVVAYHLQSLVDSIGWERAKVEYKEVRELLQRYGTEAGRDIHGQDCWVNLAIKTMESTPSTNFVVTDVRFPNEVKALVKAGAALAKITRPGVKSVNSHISDQELPDHLFHHFIRNNGTLEELEARVNEFIQEKGLLQYTTAKRIAPVTQR